MSAKPSRFKQAGDTIRFDIKGVMLDGQTRLHALIESGSTIVFWFIVGLPEDAREVIDFGCPRKVAQVVRNLGYENYFILASAATWLLKFKKGQGEESGLGRSRDAAGTAEEILDVVRAHPNLVQSCRKGKQARSAAPLPGSLVAAVHYIGAELLREPARADAFVKAIKSGSAPEGSAALAWLRELEERQLRGLHMERLFKARGTVEAWNLFASGKKVERIDIPERCAFKNLDYKLL